jgi:hypothetical protein
MKTKTMEIFSFNELDETARQNAIESLWDINVDHEWYDCLIDEFETQLIQAGFSNIEIEFSGFWSQGNGLSFTGHFSNESIHDKSVIYYESIKEFLGYVKHKHCYFDIKRLSSRYSHENTVSTGNEYLDIRVRRIMQEFYQSLESQYDYLTKDDRVIESIIANEYEFDIDGNLI